MKSEKCLLSTLNCTFVRAFLSGSPVNVLISLFFSKFHIAKEEYPNIWNNRAFCDKFFNFGMVLGMALCYQNPSQTKWSRPQVTSRGQIKMAAKRPWKQINVISQLVFLNYNIMYYHFLYVLRHDESAFGVISMIWGSKVMFKVNYELNLQPYRPTIIVKKNCLETNFQFLKICMVLGMRNMLRKYIAKKWVRPFLTSD